MYNGAGINGGDDPGALDIFGFRLGSTRRNLDMMDSLKDSLHRRNAHLKELRHDLGDDRLKIANNFRLLRDQIANISRSVNEYEEVSITDIMNAANGALHHLSTLEGLHKEARQKANMISVLQLDPSAVTPSDGVFGDRIKASKTQLSEIEARGNDSLVKPWQELKGVGSLWVEYLDYITGLSLRHEGLDAGVCDIADALIRELQAQSSELGALAIPGREGCIGALPKIVYLRFPEWTVWSLPLAAHELWLIAESGAEIANLLNHRASRELGGPTNPNSIFARGMEGEKPKRRKPKFLPYLADAFATYTIGPAYAWSSLLLRLDPMVEEDQFRARVILNTLRRLSGNHSLRPFDSDHEELAHIWQKAIEQAGVQAVELDEDYARWADCLLNQLDDTPHQLTFPIETWVGYRDGWINAFLDGADVSIELDTPKMNIRFALNAAWKARLQRPRASKIIAESCFKLCNKLEKRPPAIPPGPDRSTGEWPNAY